MRYSPSGRGSAILTVVSVGMTFQNLSLGITNGRRIFCNINYNRDQSYNHEI